MDYQDIRTLRILEEIEGNQAPSQRYLSDQLNISLGLVNSFLKRLAQKGYFKATTIPKNRVKYILTPKGVLEKSRLTFAYVQHSFQYYRDARKKLRNTLARLDREGIQGIVFYGTGDLAEIAYLSLQETDINLLAIVDPEHHSKPFFKLRIQQTDFLHTVKNNVVLITKIDSDGSLPEKIAQQGINEKNIITFQ
jgi:DNA-binding MarR family transcriptional regulator